MKLAFQKIVLNKDSIKNNYLAKYSGNPQLSEISDLRLTEYFTVRIKKSVYPARKDLINISNAFTYAV